MAIANSICAFLFLPFVLASSSPTSSKDLSHNPALYHKAIATNFYNIYTKAFNDLGARKSLGHDFYTGDSILYKDGFAINGSLGIQEWIDRVVHADAKYSRVESLSSTAFGGDVKTNEGGEVLFMGVGVKERSGGEKEGEGEGGVRHFTESILLSPRPDGEYKIVRHIFITIKD